MLFLSYENPDKFKKFFCNMIAKAKEKKAAHEGPYHLIESVLH